MRYEGIFVYRENRSREIRSERRVVDKSMRKEVPIMEKRQLTEDIQVLVRQLVMQNQMVMASKVLIAVNVNINMYTFACLRMYKNHL